MCFSFTNVFATIVKWAIIGFAALVALEQLQIAPNLMTVLFTAIIGALALAFGLAFGLGGQESAHRWLARSETTVSNVASQVSAQQQITQPQMSAEEMRAEQMRLGQMRVEHQRRMEQMRTDQAQTGQPYSDETPTPGGGMQYNEPR